MIKRSQTTHIIIHTAGSKRLKEEYAEDPTDEIRDTWVGEDMFDERPKKHWESVDHSADIIRNYHTDKLGWSDIGYHYVIRLDGTIEKGRDEDLQGAHCKDMNMNERSVGICCSGHGDIKPLTDTQEEAVKRLVNDLRQKYDIPISNVLGHRETGANKTCPGILVDMNDIRGFLAEESNISKAEPDPIPDSDGKDDFTEGKEYEKDIEKVDLPESAHETFDNRNKRTNTMKPFNETAFGRTLSGQNKTGRFIFSVIDVVPIPNVHEVIKAVIKDADQEERALNAAELVTETFQRLDYMRTIVGGGVVAAYLMDYVSFEKAQQAFQLITSLV